MSRFSHYGQEDFSRALQDLLPRGRAFPRGRALAPVQAAVMDALADGFYATHTRAVALLDRESDPAYAVELLPEWERDYGLPDTCTVAAPTIEQRQAAVLAKIASSPGGQSIAYYTQVAAALGYAITITEYQPFRFGMSHFGDLLAGPGWQFVWQVNALQITLHFFRLGISAFGEYFSWLDTTELECRLNQIKPAHTTLIFRYS